MQIDFNGILRKVLIRIWSLGLFILILLGFYPISYGLIRLSTIGLIVILYLGLIYLTYKNFLVRSLLILFLSILSIFAIAPNREFNTESLRNDYISQLNKYEGTNYIWGGEKKYCNCMIIGVIIKFTEIKYLFTLLFKLDKIFTI